MYRNIPLAGLILWMLLLGACGPDTIFLRPGLDTPDQHVKNGHSLLSCGKIDAAHTEFLHAKRLNAAFVPAYVGIALVQGHRGDITGGFETLRQARQLAITQKEIGTVDQGVEQLRAMQLETGK
ncbi:hypothetical protein DSCO28_49540 [Desulfosarcina ovata subsp. sediminis]|uniref:Lipoprotein n=1 Tax=Desulfosarcina ovata subsp. sediminis TaxID=885957 RepID=A0A5K7ZVZ7_9BACT|nr:hypothetical protein [Desulfosarcina ovata]BBO84388.1 hypothetical protein DSCO28_49540 [Desulfosarcina ovata subsp. sediminis]